MSMKISVLLQGNSDGQKFIILGFFTLKIYVKGLHKDLGTIRRETTFPKSINCFIVFLNIFPCRFNYFNLLKNGTDGINSFV